MQCGNEATFDLMWEHNGAATAPATVPELNRKLLTRKHLNRARWPGSRWVRHQRVHSCGQHQRLFEPTP